MSIKKRKKFQLTDTWKIQLTIANNFVSSIDYDEERVMHLKSDNIEIIISDEADEVMKNFFDSLKKRYQNNLESIKGGEFLFDYFQLLYHKCHKINPNHVGSYIDSPDLIINRKETINPVNKKDNKCFQYAVTVALNHEEIQKDWQRITNINPFLKLSFLKLTCLRLENKFSIRNRWLEKIWEK